MKKNKKLVPGPMQRMWIRNLKKYPERQMHGSLGIGTPLDYHACCMGEGLLCYHRIKHKKLPFSEDKYLFDKDKKGTKQTGLPIRSYKEMGLHTPTGSRKDKGYILIGWKDKYGEYQEASYKSLVSHNDAGTPWPEIAKYIEENLDQLFTKSV